MASVRAHVSLIVVALLLAGGALLLVSCRLDVPRLPSPFVRATPHEAYADALRRAGLHETALGAEWLVEADRVLAAPLTAQVPLDEVAWFPDREARAAAWQLPLERGQRVEVRASVEADEPTRVFVDLFEVTGREGDGRLRHVESANEESLTLGFEVRRTATYVLRVQPELLRGARVRVTQTVEAALAFPVPGFDRRAVQSFFGAVRDGGRREHHGIDIFAPRGTPVVAAASGLVTSVGVSGLGGNVVWVWDPSRGQSHYYAHLETQTVSAGQRVIAGQTTVGTVGNTGNARGTAPHLHFGVYASGEGPIDPLPFVVQTAGAAPRLTASLEPLGTNVRMRSGRTPLRSTPSGRAPALTQLDRHTVARVEGAAGGFHRVRLPDGSSGYLAAAATEPLSKPLRQFVRPDDTVIRLAPRNDGVAMGTLAPGAPAAVLGQFGSFLLVRAGDLEGWVQPA
jgi:peptidoglycan LD-endopeptidase LytH